MAMAGPQPNFSPKETDPIPGSFDHHSISRLPQSPPIQKNTNTNTMRRFPPPTVNKVPDPQPPPNCIPIPNRNAPNAMEMLTGAMAPLTP